MKSWRLSDEIRGDSKIFEIVNGSRPLLEEVIGPTAGLVDARWSMVNTAAGRRAVLLTLSDWTHQDGVAAVFEPNELSSELLARRKFRHLWSDLLQARNHYQLRQLEQAVTE